MRKQVLALALVLIAAALIGWALRPRSHAPEQLGTDRDAAKTAAEAVLDVCALKLQQDPTFGLHREKLRSLSFDVQDKVFSLNNLNGDRAVLGWNGRVVPPHTAHLVATSGHLIVEELVSISPDGSRRLLERIHQARRRYL